MSARSALPWEPQAEAELTRWLTLRGMDPARAEALRRSAETITRVRGGALVTSADLIAAGISGPGAGAPVAETTVAWDEQALRQIERETIYLRERLRARAEALVREAGRHLVTLQDLAAVRRMPARSGRPTTPAVAGDEPAWPVTFGAYLVIDPQCPVAICTLASESLMETLFVRRPAGTAIIGRALTENFGVEKLVTNLVTNARLRVLVLCGAESRHRVGETMVALHANGVDGDGRVIGSTGPLPLVKSLAPDAVRIFREKLTLVDLRDEDQVDVILARVAAAAAGAGPAWQETWTPTVPTISLDATPRDAAPMASRFTPDPTGFFLIGIAPSGKTIQVEHYTREGVLDHRITAASAETLSAALAERNLLGDLRHAIYVGRELQKAETALRLGLPYEQDRNLDLPAPPGASLRV